MKVVIPAAGLGTRFLPATKSMPKEMLPVGQRPVIQYVVEEAVAAGADDIILVTGRGKRSIEDHFDHSPDLGDWNAHPALRSLEEIAARVTIHYVRQRMPTGLASAILCAERHVGSEPFGVLLGDSIYEAKPPVLAQLADAQARWAPGGSAIALEKVPDALVDHYGIVGGPEIAPGVVRVERLLEKPSIADAPSRLALTGAYFLSPSVFSAIRDTPAGRRGEIELTDALQRLALREPMVGLLLAGRRYDTGTPAQWLETNVRFAARDPESRRTLRSILDESGPTG